MSGRRLRRLAIAVLAATVPLVAACRRPPPFGYDFEDAGALDALEWKCRTLLGISAEHATSGGRSLKVSFFPAAAPGTANYPGVSFRAFDPDWSGKRRLVLDVHNPGDDVVPLRLRIEGRGRDGHAEHGGRALAVPPGTHSVAVALAELADTPTKRPLNLRAVRKVMLYVSNPREPRTLYVDRVRLE